MHENLLLRSARSNAGIHSVFLWLRESAGANAEHATGLRSDAHANAIFAKLPPNGGRNGARLLKAKRQDRSSLAPSPRMRSSDYDELESPTRSS